MELASRISYATTFEEGGPLVELELVQSLLNNIGADQEQWGAMMVEVGVRHYESQQLILDNLPLLSNEAVLADTIQSLLPVHIEENHRLAVNTTIRPYLTHQNADVRAAATYGIGKWGSLDDQAYVVADGLLDDSVDVRFAAAETAALSDAQSPQMKAGLLQIVSNTDEEMGLRYQAMLALTNYPLSEQELSIIDSFNQEIENHK